MSSRLARAIIYSLMLFSCSLAMLKIMDTVINVDHDGRLPFASSKDDLIARGVVLTISGMMATYT